MSSIFESEPKFILKNMSRLFPTVYSNSLYNASDFQISFHIAFWLDVFQTVKGLLEQDPNLLQGGPSEPTPHTLSTNTLKMDALCDVWGLYLEQVKQISFYYCVLVMITDTEQN